MAVNQTKCQNGQLFLTNDYVISDKDGVEFSFENTNALPGYLKHSRKGRLILTGQKIIFVSSVHNDQCQSITLSFHYIRNMEIKQPIFGANYLQADITAEPGAGWQGDAVFKVTFSKGGAIEFAEAFQRAVQNAKARGHGQPAAAAMHQPQVNGHFYQYPPPPPQQPGYGGGYQPPPAAYYGGYPAPPPYQPQPNPPAYNPGYNPGVPPMQYNQYQGVPPNTGKAAEAYASGQNVYVPAPQNNVMPSAPPPPYQEDKKQQ